MTTYIAWDGNEYPLPVPDGWYLGSDDRWWPEGHGPGPAPDAPPAPAGFADLPSAAPPPASGLPSAAPPAGSPADWSSAPADQTVYSSPPPGAGGPPPAGPSSDTSDGNGKRFAILAAVLVGLIAIGAGAFFALSGGDDDGETTATTVFQTEQPDTGAATTAPPAEGDAATDTTAAPVTAAPGRGSVDDPYAQGEVIVLQYVDPGTNETRVWNIEVVEPVSDITQATLDENQFNDPPEGDQIFAGARIRVTYVSGPAPASLFELTFKAVGPSGVVLTTFDPSCGVIPDALDTFAELFEGGVVEGNICWPASPADAADLTMIVEGFLVDNDVYADLGG